jgi:hypothetical protein
MKPIWTVSGQHLKAEQQQKWHVQPKEHIPRHIRRNEMNRQDETAFTRFTEITEAKQNEVRRMQTEVTLSIFRAIVATLRRVLRRSPHSEGVQVLDQA